jgi:RHS repeat-associated protein
VNLPGALVTVTMANGPVGTSVYTALPAPVTLEANKAYYLVTSVTDQGDTWYDWNQPVSSTGGVSIVSTVWAPPGGGYSRYGAGSSSYGPVGLKSGSGAQIGVTTTLASYEFDDENQLVSVTQGTDRRTTFVYDGRQRRRVTREETKGSSGQWVLASETRYVYDGMRVIQERNINGVPTVAYTRGPDLSGTLEGAGGIGGLLARSEWDGSAWSRHAFYHSDGVGNVTALAVPNGNDIALAGSYRYDPFGRLIGTPTGLAAISTQRYSSKDWHNPSGFYYFGYRFYDPATQRWLNRDPIAEEGGVNLYGYVGNAPTTFVDLFGLKDYSEQETRDILHEAEKDCRPFNPPENICTLYINHRSGGKHDYKLNNHNDTFVVKGERVAADEFGNYIAGYMGRKCLGLFGYLSMRAGGIFYGWGENRGSDEPWKIWDDEGSIKRINAGDKDATVPVVPGVGGRDPIFRNAPPELRIN